MQQQQLDNQQHTSLDGFGDDAFDCHTIADKNYTNPSRTRNIISSSFIKGTHLDIKHTSSMATTTSPAYCRSGSNSSSSSSNDSGSSTNSSTTTCSATPTIGVNLRVTGQCSQGGRKYMEDYFSVAYQQSENARDLEYAFIGIYDGHGGAEAATFAKEHLMMEIINQKSFWSDNDQDVLRAIREGYIATHYAMWREQENWPKTANGLLSTAGTTATIAFIRREKIYIGHVGDSGIVLGYQNENDTFWRAKQLTTDHKPESTIERRRINRAGGKVGVKSGVPRVVWNRPRTACHRGPIRQNTPVHEIPFLAVARSLGDLWSYNADFNEFVVSPDPDVQVIKINPQTFRCLIFGTDGLWNVVTPQEAVDTVFRKESLNERLHADSETKTADDANPNNLDASQWTNPSKGLVEQALKTWSSKKMRADNTSVVTVILYPPNYDNNNGTTSTTNTTRSTCESVNKHTHIDDNEFSVPLMDQTSFQELAEKYLPPESFRNIIYDNIIDDYDTNMDTYHKTNQEHQLHEEHRYWQQQQQQHHHHHNHHQQHLDNQNITWEEKISMIYGEILADDITDGTSEAKIENSLQSFNEILKPLTPYGNYTPNDVLPIVPLTSSVDATTSVHKLDEGTTCNSDLYINGFAETYNSLLDAHATPEQSSGKCIKSTPATIVEQQHQAQPVPSTSKAAATTTATPFHAGLPMQEILQEQEMYQLQCMSGEDGYMLTKLETRREQQRCGGIQTFKVFDEYSASTSAAVHDDANNNMSYGVKLSSTLSAAAATEATVPPTATTSSHQMWNNFHDYHAEQHETLAINKTIKSQQQKTMNCKDNEDDDAHIVAARLLELNSLLQQEHAEEQQVALELEQQQHYQKMQQQQHQEEEEEVDILVNVLPHEEQSIIPLNNNNNSITPMSSEEDEIVVELIVEAVTDDKAPETETLTIEELLMEDAEMECLDETVQINEISSSSTESSVSGGMEYENTKKLKPPTLFIEKIEKKMEVLHDKPESIIGTMPAVKRQNITTTTVNKTTTTIRGRNFSNNKMKNDALVRKAMKSPYYAPLSSIVPTRSRSHTIDNNKTNNVNKSMQRNNLRMVKQQFPNIPNENQRQSSTAVNLRSSGGCLKRHNVVTKNNTSNNNNSNNIKERRQLRSSNNNNAQNNNHDIKKNVNKNTRIVNITVKNNNHNDKNNKKNININSNNNNNNNNNNIDYYSKRTLRTRNSLSKDMKAKTTIASSGGGAGGPMNKNNALKRGISTQMLRSNVNVGISIGSGRSVTGVRDNFLNSPHVINLRSRQVASSGMVKAASAANVANVVTRNLRNLRSNPANGVIAAINNKMATTSANSRLQIIGSINQLATTPPSAAKISAVAAAMATTRGQRTAAMAATSVFPRRKASSSSTTTTTTTNNNNSNNHKYNATMSGINNKRLSAASLAFTTTNVSLQNVRNGRVTKRLRR